MDGVGLKTIIIKKDLNNLNCSSLSTMYSFNLNILDFKVLLLDG